MTRRRPPPAETATEAFLADPADLRTPPDWEAFNKALRADMVEHQRDMAARYNHIERVDIADGVPIRPIGEIVEAAVEKLAARVGKRRAPKAKAGKRDRRRKPWRAEAEKWSKGGEFVDVESLREHLIKWGCTEGIDGSLVTPDGDTITHKTLKNTASELSR